MIAYTESDVLLSIDLVTKEYGGRRILDGVSATIRNIHIEGKCKGQIVGFLGPSGVGKSTLFRIMAGLEQPTSGSVTLGASGEPVRMGQVGVVAQSYPLFAHRTVMGNLMLAAELSHMSKKDAAEKVTAYLNEFDLYAERDHYPAQLSGGQRQRTAILQQVLTQGHFLLMDEPFSGLDPVAKAKTTRLIQRIADLDELNTIIIVSHDVQTTATIADHLWIMGRNMGTPGATITRTYDLAALGLAWREDFYTALDCTAFVQSLNEGFVQR